MAGTSIFPMPHPLWGSGQLRATMATQRQLSSGCKESLRPPLIATCPTASWFSACFTSPVAALCCDSDAHTRISGPRKVGFSGCRRIQRRHPARSQSAPLRSARMARGAGQPSADLRDVGYGAGTGRRTISQPTGRGRPEDWSAWLYLTKPAAKLLRPFPKDRSTSQHWGVGGRLESLGRGLCKLGVRAGRGTPEYQAIYNKSLAEQAAGRARQQRALHLPNLGHAAEHDRRLSHGDYHPAECDLHPVGILNAAPDLHRWPYAPRDHRAGLRRLLDRQVDRRRRRRPLRRAPSRDEPLQGPA
jgi:hypothetical protein